MLQLILVQHRRDFYSAVLRVYMPAIEKVLSMKRYGDKDVFQMNLGAGDNHSTGDVYYNSEIKKKSSTNLKNVYYCNIKYN